MSKELTTMDEAAIDSYLAGEAANFDTYAVQEAGVTEAAGFLRFNGNTGVWSVKNTDLGDEFQMACDLWNAQKGWMGWSGGKPIKQHWALIRKGEPLPDEHMLEELPKIKEMDGWKKVIKFTVKDVSGEVGELELTLPAEAGWRPSNRLIKSFGDHMRQNFDVAAKMPKIPIVTFSKSQYDSKGGPKWAPEMSIDDWATQAELKEMLALDGDETDDAVEMIEEAPPKPEPAKAAAPRPGSFRANRRGGRTA